MADSGERTGVEWEVPTGSGRPDAGKHFWEDRVLDVAFLALTLAVFAGLFGLIKGLERL